MTSLIVSKGQLLRTTHSSSKLRPEGPADHEIDPAAFHAAVRRDGANRAHGAHQDEVAQHQLTHPDEETEVANDVAHAEEEKRAEH